MPSWETSLTTSGRPTPASDPSLTSCWPTSPGMHAWGNSRADSGGVATWHECLRAAGTSCSWTSPPTTWTCTQSAGLPIISGDAGPKVRAPSCSSRMTVGSWTRSASACGRSTTASSTRSRVATPPTSSSASNASARPQPWRSAARTSCARSSTGLRTGPRRAAPSQSSASTPPGRCSRTTLP